VYREPELASAVAGHAAADGGGGGDQRAGGGDLGVRVVFGVPAVPGRQGAGAYGGGRERAAAGQSAVVLYPSSVSGHLDGARGGGAGDGAGGQRADLYRAQHPAGDGAQRAV